MISSDELYKGNNAEDYQPPTGNPQSTGTNLQPGTSGVAPTAEQNNVSQQRLPAVDNLKVIILQNGSGSTDSRLTPVETATQTWIGPFWGTVVLALVIVIVWAVRILAKEEAPKLAEAFDEAIKEPLLAEEAAPTEKITAINKKKSTKKSPARKLTKKKSKKR